MPDSAIRVDVVLVEQPIKDRGSAASSTASSAPSRPTAGPSPAAPSPQGVRGECNLERRRITLSTDLDPDAELRILVHEAPYGEGSLVRIHGRARAECIVESATFIVCARISLDVAASSVPYIAGWDVDDQARSNATPRKSNRVALAIERRIRA